jgi:hypothetical protein
VLETRQVTAAAWLYSFDKAQLNWYK